MVQGRSREVACVYAAHTHTHTHCLGSWICPQKVDIFSKDYLLVPIHDTLHWSLAIVCHPGAVRGSLAQEEGVTPCILHLDSMEGSAAVPGQSAVAEGLTWHHAQLCRQQSAVAEWLTWHHA
eukprot:1160466-Pelagomonas_calceolata.AAC.8